MKKLLLIPILAGAAFLAQPDNADAGFSFNIGFSEGYGCNAGYVNYRPLYRPGYYGPARVVIVDGHRRYLRPWNQRPGFRRAAKAQRKAYRAGYRQGARRQYFADRGYRGRY